MFTMLAAAAAALGPLALAGGPLGIGIAWVGSLFANKTLKVVAVLVGLGLLAATSVGITIRIEHLEQDSAALAQTRLELKAERDHVAAIARRMGCDTRAEAERELGACLSAQRADAEHAKALEIRREREDAAREQARLDREHADADKRRAAEDAAIDAAAAGDDGPLPKVLLDAWGRERKARGLK
jgi:hypothetical protein